MPEVVSPPISSPEVSASKDIPSAVEPAPTIPIEISPIKRSSNSYEVGLHVGADKKKELWEEGGLAGKQAVQEATSLYDELEQYRNPDLNLDPTLVRDAGIGFLADKLAQVKKAERAIAEHKFAAEKARMEARIAELEARAQTERADTAETKAKEQEARAEKAEKIAKENETTHLPNHIALKEKLDKLASSEDYQDKVLSLLYLDVEGLGLINDTISHMAGDKLLRKVAKVIAKTIRSDDELYHSTEDDENAQDNELETGGRLYHKHGDEMQILLEGADAEVAERVAHRVVEALKAEVLPALQAEGYLLDRTDPIAAGVGITTKMSGEIKDPDQLLDEGDIGMKTAKTIRQNNRRKNLEHQAWKASHPSDPDDFHPLPTSGIIVTNDGTLSDPGYVKDKSLNL